jgi:hypothetical protein
MMRRAYIVYVLMFAALIGGMTLIWTRGDNVRAPDDLSGDWLIEWDNASRSPGDTSSSASGRRRR